jgi:hypothetical protein
MKQLPTVSRPIIEPLYSQSVPNEPIEFEKTALRFEQDGTTVQVTAFRSQDAS